MAPRGAGDTTGDPHAGELLGVLLGNYRVLSKLGEGGMGEVFVGRHETLGNLVAVKVLQLEMSRKADMVRRFFNEAQAATAIRNLGIAQVFDFGATPDGRAYFVMELLEGQSLAARLKFRRLDYVECCRLGRQAANVLQAAHSAGITHRDLKPDNLFLIPDAEVMGGERVKVLDFGIAKVLVGFAELAGDSTEVRTRTGLMMGTPHYMSPEQCRGAGLVDARSDIYSLGCILFKMTCGRPPFIGEGAGEILGAHQYLEAPHPQSFAPDMPPELAALIARMLAKHPDARPQAMSLVSQALDEILLTFEGPSRVSGQMAVPSRPGSSTAPPPLSSPPRSRAPSTAPPPVSIPPRSRAFSTAPPPIASPEPPPASSPPRPGSSTAPPPIASPEPRPIASPEPPPIASPEPLPDASPEPSLVESAPSPYDLPPAALGGSTGVSNGWTRRRRLLLGGLAVASAALAFVIVLVARGSGSPEVPIAREETTPPAPDAALAGDDVTVPEAAVVLVAVADAVADDDGPAAGTDPPIPAVAPAAPAIVAVPNLVEIECLRYLTDKNWSALLACTQRLRPSNAPLADKLMNRATQESQSAPRIAAVEAALREKNLKRARTELDQVWTDSGSYPRIKASYDAAEEAAIAALVAGLRRVNNGDCKEYLRILAQEREAQPPRVAAEAQRQVECKTESSACDELAAKGKGQVAAGQFAAALASYEAAYACKPERRYLRSMFVIACNLKDVAKAKSIWSKLPEELKQATLGECVRNGITEKQLDLR